MHVVEVKNTFFGELRKEASNPKEHKDNFHIGNTILGNKGKLEIYSKIYCHVNNQCNKELYISTSGFNALGTCNCAVYTAPAGYTSTEYSLYLLNSYSHKTSLLNKNRSQEKAGTISWKASY